MEMSIPAQVFLLFYAVTYGVIFTISDRWRPFFMQHSNPSGWLRLVCALAFFGLLPLTYFTVALPQIMNLQRATTLNFLAAAYAVGPLLGFYLWWTWCALWNLDRFYTQQEQDTEPLRSSLQWVKGKPVSLLGVTVLTVLFILGPLVIVLVCAW